MEIDYALAWDFYLPDDSRPFQLRFRRSEHFSDIGQLIAVVAKFRHPDNGYTVAISHARVDFNDVETALEGWQQWAKLTEWTVDLGAIRNRLRHKGLA